LGGGEGGGGGECCPLRGRVISVISLRVPVRGRRLNISERRRFERNKKVGGIRNLIRERKRRKTWGRGNLASTGTSGTEEGFV